MTRKRAARKSLKKKQEFHGKKVSKGKKLIERVPAIRVVSINGKLYVKKTPSHTFLQYEHLKGKARNASLARKLTIGESIVSRGLWRVYQRLLRKGQFKNREYSLRPLKILRANASRIRASKNFLLTEFLEKPNGNALIRFIKKGESGHGKKMDQWCAQFTKENGLDSNLNNRSSREILAQRLYSAIEGAAKDLETAGLALTNKARKQGLNPYFSLDFFDRRIGVGPKPAARNFIVESFKGGKFNLVFLDPLGGIETKELLPTIKRTKKRNKRAEVEAKGRAYSTKGHQKRRKEN